MANRRSFQFRIMKYALGTLSESFVLFADTSDERTVYGLISSYIEFDKNDWFLFTDVGRIAYHDPVTHVLPRTLTCQVVINMKLKPHKPANPDEQVDDTEIMQRELSRKGTYVVIWYIQQIKN